MAYGFTTRSSSRNEVVGLDGVHVRAVSLTRRSGFGDLCPRDLSDIILVCAATERSEDPNIPVAGVFFIKHHLPLLQRHLLSKS